MLPAANTSNMNNTTLRFAVLMGGYYTTALIAGSFLPMYMNGFGYSDVVIGFTAMCAKISCLVCMLSLGFVADKYNSMKQIIITVLAVITISMPLLFLFSDYLAVVIVFAVVTMGPSWASGSVIDSWVTKLGTVDYGKVRAVGSFAYAAFSIILGYVFAAMGNHVSSFFMAGTFIIVLIALIKMKNPEPKERTEIITIKASLSYLLKNKYYLFMLTGYFLLGLADTSESTFFPILIADLGGSQAEVGIAFALMAAIEIVTMVLFTRLKNRFNTALLLTVGIFGTCLKILAFSVSTEIWQIYLFCILQCVSYALVAPGTVLFMSEKIDNRYLTAALLINEAVLNISMTIANPVCGILSESFGVSRMFMITSFPALIAGIVFLFMLKKLRSENGILSA